MPRPRLAIGQPFALISCLLTLASTGGVASAQSIRTESIPPQTTDPAITAWTGSHYAAFNTTGTPRGRLFVYLHGLGGSGNGATELVKTAAEEGFHAVGVTYANDWIPASFCA